MPKVFISHSWEDNEVSRKLADNLRRDGAEVWVDYVKIKAGDSFIKRMNEGLEWCDTFILLWSKSAEQSDFVLLEWEAALANKVKIIPCLLDKTKLPFILSGRIYKDLSNFDEGYDSLAKDLNLTKKGAKLTVVKKVVKIPATPVVPKPEISEPKRAIFRNHAQALSADDVKSMVKRYGFFDKFRNENGKGFTHAYELITINGDEVVIDNAAGLMWQQGGSQDYITYDAAKKYIDDLNKNGLSGYKVWRLPTLEEAMSLMEPKEMNGDLYVDPKFDATQRWIWTSDSAQGASWAWVVSFDRGGCGPNLSDYNYYVRAVRFGQSSPE